jgi:hypothetical protein
MQLPHKVLTIALAVLLTHGGQAQLFECRDGESACVGVTKPHEACCQPAVCNCGMSAPVSPQPRPESAVAMTPTGFGYGKNMAVHPAAVAVADAVRPALDFNQAAADPHASQPPRYSLTHAFLI